MKQLFLSVRTAALLTCCLAFVGGPVSPLLAECLGCPAGAQAVEVYLDKGLSVRGFVVIHPSMVKDVIDAKELPLERARGQVWRDGKLQIWTERSPAGSRSWPPSSCGREARKSL